MLLYKAALAENTDFLFTKDGDQLNNLHDMQCMSGSKAVDILQAYEETLEDDYPPYNEHCEHGEMLLYKISLLEECGLIERALEELHKKEFIMVDKLSYKEQEVSLLEKLGHLSRYDEGLQRCMGLYLVNGLYSSDEIDRLESLYASLSKQYSRSSAVKDRSIRGLTRDPFEDSSPKPGLSHFKLSLIWGLSIKSWSMCVFQNRMYIHGLWPEGIIINSTPLVYGTNTYIDCMKEFNEVWLKNRHDLMKYWPNLDFPESYRACREWLRRVWIKHGYSYDIPPRMYFTYALALRLAIPDDFGISVGTPMTIGDACVEAKEELKKLVVFGEFIGKDFHPEMFSIVNPTPGVPILKEVRPHFEHVSVGTKAKLRLKDAPRYYRGECKMYGDIVIMPSSKYP